MQESTSLRPKWTRSAFINNHKTSKIWNPDLCLKKILKVENTVSLWEAQNKLIVCRFRLKQSSNHCRNVIFNNTSSSRYRSCSNTMICTNNHCFSYKFRLTSRLCKTLYATETFQLNLVFILWQQKKISIAVIVRYGYVTQTAAVYVSCCKSSSVAAVSTFLRPQPPIKSPIVLTIILL